MMNKIIIHYKDTKPTDALEYVSKVIEQGRISDQGECYCRASVFKDGTEVLAELTKRGNDVFRVYGKENNI